MTKLSHELPQLCSDEERHRRDLDEHGYCLVADAIGKDILEQIYVRIRDQAAEERSRGLTPLDDVQVAGGDDGNQYVYMLINKGRVFQELLLQPHLRSLVAHVLGEEYLLSDMAAIITHPSNGQMGMHTDQWWLPGPSEPGRVERKSGSITRNNLLAGSAERSANLINPPVVCNVLWMISDFCVDNGATRVVPGSHLSGHNPDHSIPVETVNAVGPAGTAVVLEGRTWHGADFNRASAPRHAITTFYCAPMMRQMANLTYGTRPDVIDSMPPALFPLLGFKPWGGYGATGEPHAEHIKTGSESLGELYPQL